MSFDFAADAFDVFAGKAQHGAFLDGAAAAIEHGGSLDRARRNLLYQSRGRFREGRANQKQCRKTIESAGTVRCSNRAVLRIQQNRIHKNALAADKDVIAGLEAMECPSLAARDPPGSEPVQQYEGGVIIQMKFLPLPIAGTRKGLNGVR